MALTKPAGCAVQALGAPFAFFGFFGVFGAIADPSQLMWGVPCFAFGVLLLWVGRKTGE
jgi:hypothetical protein